MGGLSIWHIVIVGMIALLLFGGSGKISDLMGDVAKGVKSFRTGLKSDDENTPGVIAKSGGSEIIGAPEDQAVGP